jgi:hypothetical protein
MSPNSCLNSFYRLGDPVMDWECWLSGSSSFQFYSCLADGPRGPGGRSANTVFFACSSCSCSASLSIRFGFELWLEVVSDSLQQRADDPRVPGGQSSCSPRTVRYLGSSLEVLFAFSDGPWRRAGQSAAAGRTVRVARADGPPLLAGRSARAWVFCSLVRFLPPSFVLPRVLQGIVRKTWGWSITLLSWWLACDSIHRLCVTGNCLGYTLGSLRRIFTGSYSLPPSLVAIRSFIHPTNARRRDRKHCLSNWSPSPLEQFRGGLTQSQYKQGYNALDHQYQPPENKGRKKRI